MSKIVITGDVHGQHKRIRKYREQLKAGDILIICGDFGFIWTKENRISLNQFQKYPFQILWIDGNHQNFARLYSDYQVVQKYGSPTHKIRDNIYHLMRGNVYTIQQKTFFCFGGGISIDKQWRTPYISWWPQQIPTAFEYQTGIANLEAVNNNIDYIITHTAPGSLKKAIQDLAQIKLKLQIKDPIMQYMDIINQKTTFRKWFIGHYHFNKLIHKKYQFLYQDEIIIS